MAVISQVCAKCGSQFLIIDQEQKFLSSKNLSLPKNCPGCRQMRRLMLRGGERRLYKTNCQKCNKEIIVAYDPKKVSNKILCKQDYDKYFQETDAIIKDPLPEI